VIGADTHKRSHALAAVDGGLGRVRGRRSIDADEAGFLAGLRWARGVDAERVWAIEDCRHVSRRFEQALLAAGERVIRVAPRLMGASRRGEREPGKSDQIDAVAVARAVLREGIEHFAVAQLDEPGREIRVLADYRDQLVAERTRAQNRLRWQLVELCPELEAALPKRCLDRPVWLGRVRDVLECLPASDVRARVALELVSRIRELTGQANTLERELGARIRAQHPRLLAEQGCGALTAATLISHAAGAERFKTDARFARQAGTAPIPASSGNRQRKRVHPGGDRQLNRALHTIAITRARLDPETRAYLDRKLTEGKTPQGALRCLKRHLARRFYRLLTQPASTELNPINAVLHPACLT
jgi:transposase